MSRRLALFVISCFVGCWGCVLIVLHYRASDLFAASASITDGQPKETLLLQDDGITPVIGAYVTLLSTVEAVYALPETTSVKGVALLLHACTHSALKFFSPSPACNTCVGLSEEMLISRILLSRGYAVLAVSSSDRRSGCWGGDSDIERVRAAVHEFQTTILSQQNNNHTTVVAIGASSGGRFAAVLSAHGIAQAALVMVSTLPLRRLLDMHDKMPPIYLAPMPRDKATLKKAHQDYETLQEKYGPARIAWDDRTCVPLPVTADFLHQRVSNMTRDMAERIVQTLINAEYLNADTLFWLKDPTTSDWRTILRKDCGEVCLKNQNLEPGKSPMAKAFHRAWAFHEYCSEAMPKALDFFERCL